MDGTKQRLRYAKALDLYHFGNAIFELMIGKTTETLASIDHLMNENEDGKNVETPKSRVKEVQ